ncbi:MAG: flavodoxin family protein [Vicinamibacterales bacterium]
MSTHDKRSPPSRPSNPAEDVRTGQQYRKLDRGTFDERFAASFYDPAFDAVRDQLAALADVAWDGYDAYRKSPRTRPAGDEFADPTHPLPIEWLQARQAIRDAQQQHDAADGPPAILLVCASPRTDKTCPGEMSKSYRLAVEARQALEDAGAHVDFLDLSALTAEYGRVIYPCKGCVSTAMPLCHWPCSCYPNHAMGQAGDWMHEIYPRWVAAHGVMIVSPVHWYQAPSALKLMIDRLVCADGGNPDPTTTHGKQPAEAKALELEDWPYPRHLAGRAFAVLVHGDTGGAESLRRGLSDWLTDMHLVPAGSPAQLDRYVGYYEPYATSHRALDRDEALMDEVGIAARALVETATRLRFGWRPAGSLAPDPRPK